MQVNIESSHTDTEDHIDTGEQVIDNMGDRNAGDLGEERFLQLLETLAQG